jgi:hypothetical protein
MIDDQSEHADQRKSMHTSSYVRPIEPITQIEAGVVHVHEMAGHKHTARNHYVRRVVPPSIEPPGRL